MHAAPFLVAVSLVTAPPDPAPPKQRPTAPSPAQRDGTPRAPAADAPNARDGDRQRAQPNAPLPHIWPRIYGPASETRNCVPSRAAVLGGQRRDQGRLATFGGSEERVSGEPPRAPLDRVEPRLWEARVDLQLRGTGHDGRHGLPDFVIPDAVLWWPLVVEDTYTTLDPSSVSTQLWLDDRQAVAPMARKDSLAFGVGAVGLPLKQVAAHNIRASVVWRQQCWSSRVDERAAAKIPWPAEWPAEVQEALRPQPAIESDQPEFRAFVDRVSGGKLRSVTPWIAAKELSRATVNAFRVVDAAGSWWIGRTDVGLPLVGAYDPMCAGVGSAHDLSAACVAVLRAAGIPARVVLGIAEIQAINDTRVRPQLVTWCEFYLPSAGWVPFDPVALRGASQGNLPLDRPWPSFGTWDDLNRRVPVAHSFVAPVANTMSLTVPNGWSVSQGTLEDLAVDRQGFAVQITSRGRVKE